MKFEIENLKKTLSKYDDLIKYYDYKGNNTMRSMFESKEEWLAIKESAKEKARLLNKVKSKPYFARVDFDDDICYIGKVGVMDEDNNTLTVDWRSPVATLYYDSSVGEASYESPTGTVTGNLTLKRQYDISNGKLISFNDTDLVSSDELLKPFLGVNSDHRLKNIVSTIQTEQNAIIRKPIENDLIIQGVAGSGKTTVALHRIAYLAYNYKKIINNNQYLILAPNKFFIRYISSILPDLDVGGIVEYDFESLALKYIDEDLTLISSEIDANFKTSMEIKSLIDLYVENFEKALIPDSDFSVEGFKIFSREHVMKVYYELSHKLYPTIKSRIDKTNSLLSKEISRNSEMLITNLNIYINDRYDDIETLRKTREKARTAIRSGCNSYLRSYFKTINSKPSSMYLKFMKDIGRGNFKKFSKEDLTPIMYFKYKIYGSDLYDWYRHVAIDEAQDYNDFTFYILKKIIKNASFSIYGDLAQSLYSYKSIKNWNSIFDFYERPQLLTLGKSYRTTIEIMEEANKINKHLSLQLATPVIRHGKEVSYIKIKNKYDDILKILDGMNHRTIAIISKTEELSKNVYDDLKHKIDIHHITVDNREYDQGICSISSFLSKGLEFDAVIIIDDGFDSSNDIEMKLLYVSMTRALHELYVLYNSKNILLN